MPVLRYIPVSLSEFYESETTVLRIRCHMQCIINFLFWIYCVCGVNLLNSISSSAPNVLHRLSSSTSSGVDGSATGSAEPDTSVCHDHLLLLQVSDKW